MSFDKNNMMRAESMGATGPGQTGIHSEWIFATNDAPAAVEAANYFNLAAPYVNKGDTIRASMSRSGTPVGKDYIVTAVDKAANTVTVALFNSGAG